MLARTRVGNRHWLAGVIAPWTARTSSSSPVELLVMGDQLRRHATAMWPDWPSEAERAAVPAVHQRVAEVLRATGSRLR